MDKVDEMPAGRELDAIIGECIMNARRMKVINGALVMIPSDQWQTHIPCYSTDIGAAFEIVNSRPNGTWNWRLAQEDSGDWWAEIRLGYATSYSKAFPVRAESLPLAICRAALKTLEDE